MAGEENNYVDLKKGVPLSDHDRGLLKHYLDNFFSPTDVEAVFLPSRELISLLGDVNKRKSIEKYTQEFITAELRRHQQEQVSDHSQQSSYNKRKLAKNTEEVSFKLAAFLLGASLCVGCLDGDPIPIGVVIVAAVVACCNKYLTCGNALANRSEDACKTRLGLGFFTIYPFARELLAYAAPGLKTSTPEQVLNWLSVGFFVLCGVASIASRRVVSVDDDLSEELRLNFVPATEKVSAKLEECNGSQNIFEAVGFQTIIDEHSRSDEIPPPGGR